MDPPGPTSRPAAEHPSPGSPGWHRRLCVGPHHLAVAAHSPVPGCGGRGQCERRLRAGHDGRRRGRTTEGPEGHTRREPSAHHGIPHRPESPDRRPDTPSGQRLAAFRPGRRSPRRDADRRPTGRIAKPAAHCRVLSGARPPRALGPRVGSGQRRDPGVLHPVLAHHRDAARLAQPPPRPAPRLAAGRPGPGDARGAGRHRRAVRPGDPARHPPGRTHRGRPP